MAFGDKGRRADILAPWLWRDGDLIQGGFVWWRVHGGEFAAVLRLSAARAALDLKGVAAIMADTWQPRD
ncbi:hypothetical protein [Pseudomonas putida]|uniref:hypothetical protein n=1 Tax=Pseudomonas putida TaxID=303 RepID=UPI0021F8F311|nr:hypothetical protein [Pseudomonas putida]